MFDAPHGHMISRRDMLRQGACGFGSLALAALCRDAFAGGTNALATKAPHFRPRAKRAIFLFMRGGVSQVDTFDPKPKLTKDDGKKGKKRYKLMKSPWKFGQYGQSGTWVSDLFPHLANHVDDMCVIRSLQTGSSAHPLAIPLLHTGSFQFTRPSLGSWTLYGLGTENQELPGFITINPTRVFGGPSNYGSAFLPAAYQATRIGWESRSLKNATIRHLDGGSTSASVRDRQLGLIRKMNERLLARSDADAPIEGVINSLELGDRMRESVPKLMDLGRESKETLKKYGIGGRRTDLFGRQCLMARRFVEEGVRFVQLTHASWDHHTNIASHAPKSEEIDQPMAALLGDLKQRGLLDDTLVFWSGEFGRQPEGQVLKDKKGTPPGRDHNADGFTVWMAGGGVKGGLTYGATDEYGYEAVENKVHLHDWHATILHLMGLNHEELTYRYGGRDFRLTDVHGKVVKGILA